MPTSHFHQLNEIVETMVAVAPRAVLDVGVGFAKYGVLAREYLDAAWCREPGGRPAFRIDGIEGFAAYVGALHELVYDHVYIGDAQEVLLQIDRQYDLALLIDVIEHFEHHHGLQLLKDAQRSAANILISTPRYFHEQEAVFGNELEIHRSLWQPRDFAAFHPRCFIPNRLSLICLIGPAAVQVNARLNSWRRILSRQMPWLASLYRRGVALTRNRSPE